MLKHSKINEEIIESSYSADQFETQELLKPAQVIIHETSVDIPISREMITAPIFARCKKTRINQLQIYYLNKQKTRKIEIKPPFNDSVNTEFEERVFMALIDIAKRQQLFLQLSQLPQKIFTTFSQIIKTMGLKYNTKCKNRIYDALKRLHETHYSFSHCYYSTDLDEYKEEENSTILSRFHYKSFIEIEEINPKIIDYFDGDRRIKEFVYIEISTVFYNNLIDKRAYLNFDSRSLLDIENGVARKIYMYCDRQRWHDDLEYKEKGDDLKFRVDIKVLVQIIPLAFNAKGVKNSFKIICDSLEYLKKNQRIQKYVAHEMKPLKNSWFELFFLHSRKFTMEERKKINNKAFEELGVFSQETRQTDINFNKNWGDFTNFYLQIIENDYKLSDFNDSSKAIILKDFDKDKYRSVCLANYIIKKAKDVNAYISKSDHCQYISDNDVLKLKNNYEKKLKEIDKEKEKKLKIEQQKQQEIINKRIIENEFHKLSESEKKLYFTYVNPLVEKIGGKLNSFLNFTLEEIELKLLLIIFARSTNRNYDINLENYLEKVENIKLDIRDTITNN